VAGILSDGRNTLSALAVAALFALVWWFIAWRSAPPEPPDIPMPFEAAEVNKGQ